MVYLKLTCYKHVLDLLLFLKQALTSKCIVKVPQYIVNRQISRVILKTVLYTSVLILKNKIRLSVWLSITDYRSMSACVCVCVCCAT
jgi:hypothetical protein